MTGPFTEADAMEERIADLEQALRDLLPILKAVRFTVGFGKNQIARIENAERLLTPSPTGAKDNG